MEVMSSSQKMGKPDESGVHSHKLFVFVILCYCLNLSLCFLCLVLGLCSGIELERHLLLKIKLFKNLQSAISGGIGPMKALLERSRETR